MKLNKAILTGISCLLLLCCGKKVTDTDHPELIARWSAWDVILNKGYSLTIEANGRGTWDESGSVTKGNARIHSNDIHIGLKHLTMLSEPGPDASFDSAYMSYHPDYVYPAVVMKLRIPGKYELTFFKNR